MRTYRRTNALILFGSAVFFLFWTCSKNLPLDPNQGGGEQFVLLVGLQSRPETIPPGGSSVISALVLDENNRPVPGETIDFSTSSGTVLPTSVTTNDSGLASTIFTALPQQGSAVVTGSHRDNEQTVTVSVIDSSPQSVSVVPLEQTLLANGISTTRIQSIWRTETGSPMAGLSVSFETSFGRITNTPVTDSSGIAYADFRSGPSRSDVIADITASGAGIEATTQILLKGIRFELSALPMAVIADGKSTAAIRVVLKEATSSVAIAGGAITFGADIGTVPNTVRTNERGVAETTLISANETGSSTLTATYGQTLSETLQITFTQSIPTYLGVSVQPAEILADNKSTATITAVVSDQTNNPVPDGTGVSFSIIDGTGTIESSKLTKDGAAVSTLTSGTRPDTVRIAVQAGPLADTTTVRYVRGTAASLTVSADSTTLPADGVTSAVIRAEVVDPSGNPVIDGTKVDFVATLGDVTKSSQSVGGIATARYSSSQTGTAVISARVAELEESVTIKLRPGPPNSVLLSIDPKTLGVKDSGRNQTVAITAEVVDSKNNQVADGTFVRFAIFQSPGGSELLSNTEPIPTLNGLAQVSLNSGIRSGTVRVLAEVTDSLATPIIPEVRAVTTEITIFAGPPFIEDVNDRGTSHLSVGVTQANILGWGFVNSTTTVTAVVGDKFNNPVPAGTAVYFTTSGGVISTHTGFTNEEGIASVTIHTAQPLPNVTRYYSTFLDPNKDHAGFGLASDIIPGPIPDFENSQIVNSVGLLDQNDGIGRILAETEGVDPDGSPARAWSVTNIVFSGLITVFDVTTSDTELSPGESAIIDFEIYDVNGNPIVPGSDITVSASIGSLSWSSLSTSDPGVTAYQVVLTNNLDPADPEAKEGSTPVTIQVSSLSGNMVRSSPTIQLLLN